MSTSLQLYRQVEQEPAFLLRTPFIARERFRSCEIRPPAYFPFRRKRSYCWLVITQRIFVGPFVYKHPEGGNEDSRPGEGELEGAVISLPWLATAEAMLRSIPY